MSYPPNARILLEMLRQQGNPLANTPLTPGSGSPLGVLPNVGSYTSDAYDQQEANKAAPKPGMNTESGGMLSPSGSAPGGPGTAVGTGASTPSNPAVISDPNSLQQMQTEIMRRMTEPIKVGEPPQAPNLPPAPEMAPMPGGVRGRLVAGLSGIAGIRNPYDVMREKEFQDSLAAWQAKVAPLQTAYQDRLRAYEAQTKAQMEAANAQRYGAMTAGYMAPYFGISRTGAQPGGAAMLNRVGKVESQNGIPSMVTNEHGDRLPITEAYLPQMSPRIRDLSLNALANHKAWFVETLKSLEQRGEAFRLNNPLPVWDTTTQKLAYATGRQILKEQDRYIPAPSALTMAREFGIAPNPDIIRRGQNASQTLMQLPKLEELYGQAEQMGMTGPANGRIFADFMAGKIHTTGLGPEQDKVMGELRASTEFFKTRLSQAHLGANSSEGERAMVRSVLGQLSSTPDMFYGGLEAAKGVLNDYANAVPGFQTGGFNPAAFANPSSPLDIQNRTAPPNIRDQARPSLDDIFKPKAKKPGE